MDRLDLRHISSKIYDRFVVLELEYIYLLYTTISSKKYDKFVILQSKYIYLLYTTVRCYKYDRNLPGNGTLQNVVEFTTKTFAVWLGQGICTKISNLNIKNDKKKGNNEDS